MKLYRHYKNKFYKYNGVVKHSETMEEMVVYETLYESAGGRHWVRPKSMFHEQISVSGRKQPRFEAVPFEIVQPTELSEHLGAIARMVKACFGEWNSDAFHARIARDRKFHLAIARVNGEAAGFKFGYEEDAHAFYSWLGAVLPAYRGLGIGQELMDTQHRWCRIQRYTKVRTKTQNRWKEMLLLNIKNGFQITGTEHSETRGLKILLEKDLLAE